MENICTNTLKLYMDKLTRKLEQVICLQLPEKIGIVFDGWTAHGSYYLCIYAATPSGCFLLSISPLLNEESHSAQNHIRLMEFILGIFQKTLGDVFFLSGDNCSTNIKIAKDIGVPLIGCASHRLNLTLIDSFRFKPSTNANLDMDLISCIANLRPRFTKSLRVEHVQANQQLAAEIKVMYENDFKDNFGKEINNKVVEAAQISTYKSRVISVILGADTTIQDTRKGSSF